MVSLRCRYRYRYSIMYTSSDPHQPRYRMRSENTNSLDTSENKIGNARKSIGNAGNCSAANWELHRIFLISEYIQYWPRPASLSRRDATSCLPVPGLRSACRVAVGTEVEAVAKSLLRILLQQNILNYNFILKHTQNSDNPADIGLRFRGGPL